MCLYALILPILPSGYSELRVPSLSLFLAQRPIYTSCLTYRYTHVVSSEVGLYIIVVTYCNQLAPIHTPQSIPHKTYLPLIPRRRTNRQHIPLNTTRRQMIQHRMIRHIQHRIIILHRRRRIQDRLPQESRQAGWGRQLHNRRSCILVCGRILRFVEIKEVLRDGGGIVFAPQNRLGALDLLAWYCGLFLV